MSETDIRKELLSLWEEIKKNDLLEGLLDMADELISKNPDCADVLIDLFHKETNQFHKELLATMILFGVHYQPAIDFLRDVIGWTDFTGFAGFPKS